MVRTPVIGITAGIMLDQQESCVVARHRLSAEYSDAVRAAGGLPILLPPQEGTTGPILDLVDGLLFSGGGDIHPARYGATEMHPATDDMNDKRDRFEIDLLSAALERDMPILCICRGIQLLNVVLGGSLMQHIDDEIDRPLLHRQDESGIARNEASHMVDLANDSLSATVFGSTVLPVNSFHHQALAIPAAALQIEGTTSDGVIEAVSLPSCSFVLGVQWHPEMLFASIPDQLKPFEALVAAATANTPAVVGV